jgi:hypothetical protein
MSNELDRLYRLEWAFATAREAITASVAGTAAIEEWYVKRKPEYYRKYGLPTTEASSLRCFLMEHAAQLLRDI